MLAAFAGLIGCGDARPLDPSGQGGHAGQGTVSGQGGQGQGGAGPVIIGPQQGLAITPTATECGCAPGAGIDLIACGSDWLPNTLRDAPEAVITPDGSTIIYNRCFADSPGGCASAMFRWKAGEGRSLLARGAWAFAVSADGTRALGTYTGADAPLIANANGTIGGLPLGKSYAHLLTADGNMVVARVELGPSLTMAARWNVPDGLRTLGDLVGGPDFSEPTAINADASVVVGYGNTAAGQEPFLWTSAGGMVGLPTLSSPTVQAVARATSADGAVIVGSNLTDRGTAIVRWALGTMTRLGSLYDNVPAGGTTSYFSWWSPPLLVSTDGLIIAGTAAQATNPMVPLAFRWTASGGFEALSAAPASIVRSICADGGRIVGSTLAAGAPPGMPFAPLPYQAFLFEAGVGTRPLADVLAEVELDGMTFGDPIALSADGRFLVGHATCAGAPAIFRAALP
jgi:uncharacterized membrane protein